MREKQVNILQETLVSESKSKSKGMVKKLLYIKKSYKEEGHNWKEEITHNQKK